MVLVMFSHHPVNYARSSHVLEWIRHVDCSTNACKGPSPNPQILASNKLHQTSDGLGVFPDLLAIAYPESLNLQP